MRLPFAMSHKGSSLTLGGTANCHACKQALPPVGKYEVFHALGKQPLSTFKTLPAYGFGRSSSWDSQEKRFLTQGHMRVYQVRLQ